MIDSDGYRLNVGIIICNNDGQLFWARRIGQNAWQFPQGGIAYSESTEQAVYRELREETGLLPEDVEILGETDDWLHYDLPEHLVRRYKKPICIGQKQKWFMLRLRSEDDHIKLNYSKHPEFDLWCWIDYWQPLKEVISFKRDVYKAALEYFAPLIVGNE